MILLAMIDIQHTFSIVINACFLRLVASVFMSLEEGGVTSIVLRGAVTDPTLTCDTVN